MAKNKPMFKKRYTLEARKNEALRLSIKFPDRLPVIVEKNGRSHDVPDIDKNKYLVPGDSTLRDFVGTIHRRMKLGKEKAIFVFVNKVLPSQTALMSKVYEENKDKEDGFLYMVYSGENTFGSL